MYQELLGFCGEETQGAGAFILTHTPLTPVDAEHNQLLATELKDGMLVARDSEFAFYGADVKKIFVRNCYPLLVNELELDQPLSLKTTALTGTPGVGKSIFAVYLVIGIINGWIPVADDVTSVVLFQGVTTTSSRNRLFAFMRSVGTPWRRVADFNNFNPTLFINDISSSVRYFELGAINCLISTFTFFALHSC